MSSTEATSERTDGTTGQTAQAAKPSARAQARPSREGRDIHLTEKAAAKIKEILAADNHPDTMYLYVGVKGGGCSGFNYVLDLRDETAAPLKESDEVFESQGITIVSDVRVIPYLDGTTIDYHEGLMGAGFTFGNPKARHTCGCGSSFSA